MALPDPHDTVHQPAVGGVEVGGTILETEQVAGRVAPGRLDGVGRQEAVLLPTERQQIGEVLQEVAQCVDIGLGRIGIELDQEVAVAAIAVERVVGEARHGDEPFRAPVGQAEALVEHRGSIGHGHRQIVGKPLGAEEPVVGGRQLRVGGDLDVARHQGRDPAGQPLHEPDEVGS